MTDTIQLGLGFQKTHLQAFNEWVHTPEGGHVANLFIRMAVGLKRAGKTVGARMIWERLRWHFQVRHARGETYKLNDHYHAYMSRFAMERCSELEGFFETRTVGKSVKVKETITIKRFAM